MTEMKVVTDRGIHILRYKALGLTLPSIQYTHHNHNELWTEDSKAVIT
jgi:hypothetical protein